MSIQTWIPTYDEFEYTGMGHGEDDGYGRCWILKADHLGALAAKEREIERLTAQVERAEKSCSQLADGVVRYKAQVEQYRNSHADCIFRHVDNSFAEDRFQTYDERCALCKEHDALIAARAAEKGPSNG